MDIPQILTSKYPGAQWVLDGDDYSGLEWLDDSPKPSEAELTALWPEVEAEIQAEADAKIAAKASAVAKLEALGLTVEEVSVAFGIEV